jgi:hypothetical protein
VAEVKKHLAKLNIENTHFLFSKNFNFLMKVSQNFYFKKIDLNLIINCLGIFGNK